MADVRRSLSSLQTLLADNSSGNITPQNVRDFLVSVVGANVIQSDTYANEPSSGQEVGDIFVPNDSLYELERWDGSAWNPVCKGLHCTKPSGSFAWVNQGSAQIDTSNGYHILTNVNGGNSNIAAGREVNVPSAPYTKEIGFIFGQDISVTGALAQVGIYLRDSAGGKVVSHGLDFNQTAVYYEAGQWNSFAGGIASYTLQKQQQFMLGQLVLLRFHDDNTNRLYDISFNSGKTWINVLSEARTTFMTPDKIGFFLNTYKAYGEVYVVHWK